MHVLVPVDDSEPAAKALEFALENYEDATITALHVVNPPEVMIHEQGAGESVSLGIEKAKERASALFDDLEPVEDDAVGTEVIVGETVQTILEHAEENDVDTIVMGSHGRTGWSRIALGSVAEKVVRRSPIPVTVAR